jgi:hypothetical protein
VLPQAEVLRPDPDPDVVEALILLVGDAGTALPGRSPLLARVGQDVERWAPHLPHGGTGVAYLGDLVYPDGVRPPEHPHHPRDTLHLHAQLEPLLGPGAREAGARGWFLDGNHDWGQTTGAEGVRRLRRTARVVEGWARGGLPVRFLPAPGSLGPEVVDIGSRHRLVVVGTQAWLGAPAARRRVATEALGRALRGPPRTVTVLAHHPLVSAGEHGRDPPAGPALGVRRLVSQAGLIRQDVPSLPYQHMIADVRSAGAERPPLVWAAGHDHTLQLLRSARPGDPHFTVVSGSASKLGALGRVPELLAGGAWPGYARLFLLRDGRVQLQFVAAPADAQHCAAPAPGGVANCVREKAAEYRTVVSRILAAPAP